MEKYLFLKKIVCQYFHYGMERDDASYKDSLCEGIAAQWIDVEKLKTEFELAQSDAELDWLLFSIEVNLLDNSLGQYDGSTKDDIITYLKVLMSDGLYPEKHLTKSEIELLRYDTLCIFRDAAQTGEGEDWMSVEEIIQRLRGKRSRWEVLEPYHFLGLLDLDADSFNQNLDKIKKRPLDLGNFRITPKGVHYLENTLTKWIQGRHPDAVTQP